NLEALLGQRPFFSRNAGSKQEDPGVRRRHDSARSSEVRRIGANCDCSTQTSTRKNACFVAAFRNEQRIIFRKLRSGKKRFGGKNSLIKRFKAGGPFSAARISATV